MKKFVVFLCAVTLAFSMVGTARATLHPQTQGFDTVIYDDVNEKYWIRDLSMFTSQTYDSQMSAELALDYYGSTEWTMAGIRDFNSLSVDIGENNVGDIFGPRGIVLSVPYQMSGLVTAADPDKHHVVGGYDFGGGYTPTLVRLIDALTDEKFGVWVVTAAPAKRKRPIPEPEPGTVFLLGTGLLGTSIIGLRALRRKVSHTH